MRVFEKGDYVKIVSSDWGKERVNKIYKVVEDSGDPWESFCDVKLVVELCVVNDWPSDFELVENSITPSGVRIIKGRDVELGIHRPNLEDRKVGKVPMHMVYDGFPRALKHVAEIMGWAAEVKGYKLHDWVNLPNAEIEFPAAEDRHATENSIMKAEGLSALQRVDHESGKLHIGHKVFNALAELELILSGKIK